jgi:hypothetical protein
MDTVIVMALVGLAGLTGIAVGGLFSVVLRKV